MNSKSNHHPSDIMLENFARRELPVGTSVIISAHVELCGRCRARVADFECREMREWHPEAATADVHVPDLEDMIEGIISLPRQQPGRDKELATAAQDRFVNGARLPRALHQAAVNLQWSRLTDGIHQAKVAVDHETRCEFIHMAENAPSPAHTHYGREYTLVLQGSFHDDLGSYGVGDFLLRDASHEHQPVSDNGCLCFAVLDRPLRFTRGLPRLLNPINRLRFRGGLAR